MLSGGDKIYIEILADSAERVLHAASITETGSASFSAEFEEDIELGGDEELFIYFEREREFMQQPARVTPPPMATKAPTIEEVMAAQAIEPKPSRFDFVTTGDPLSAERRQCYRVSTVVAELTAAVAGETTCMLTDVSVTGFSILCENEHRKGEVLDVTLRYGDREFQGRARIQSVKDLPSGKRRYGLSPDSGKGKLEQGQQHIAMAVQREQLKRRNSG